MNASPTPPAPSLPAASASDVRVLWSLADWADAVIALPSSGPLPRRTVLVPNEHAAHTLRRALIERDAAAELVGTRFSSPAELARELVADAGEPARTNERELGPTLARELLARVEFAHFDRAALLAVPGWDAAFARTLGELDRAQLSVSSLLTSADPQVRDVGRVLEEWQTIEELTTEAGIMRRAIALLPRGGARLGAVLAWVTGFESALEAQFLRALPAPRWALWGVRPLAAEQRARVQALYGEPFSRALAAPRPAAPPASALQRLQQRLFEHEAGDAAARHDGTVELVSSGGACEEVEAAVSWVVEQVLEHGVPLAEIALVSPRPERYAPLLRARLAALPWDEGEALTCAERGQPLAERSDGARLLLLVRALRAGLPRERLAPLLPALRGRAQAPSVRGLSRAWELLNFVGMLGGARTRLAAGRAWAEAWEHAVLRLEVAGDEAAVERKRRRELQLTLAGLAPAIEGLTDLLRHALAGEPLSLLWMRLAAFAREFVQLPAFEPPPWPALEQAIAVFDGHEEREPAGVEALDWLERALGERILLRAPFGRPALYIGSLAGLRGLSFRAVRVLGLAEGALPGTLREDPVLPDAARAALSPWLFTSSARPERVRADFHAAVGAARERLVLSAPQSGGRPGVAGVLLDVVRALAGARTARGFDVELAEALARGRARERQVQERLALSPRARLERVARGDRALAREPASAARSLDAVRALAGSDVQDGLIPELARRADLAGLSAARPISLTRLELLLACPHRYLYEYLLGFSPPVGPLPSRALAPPTFEGWLFGVAEEFWRAHGVALGERAEDFEHFRAALRALASESFDELRATYPFASEAHADAQRAALCDRLEELLRLDWASPARAFVDVERSFGAAEPCALTTPVGTLHVRGQIDRLDRDGGELWVRAIEAGRGGMRRAGELELGADLKLGVQLLAAKRLARRWGTPARVRAASVWLEGGEERAWTTRELRALEAAAREWLAAALETLQQGAFVRTGHARACASCPQRAACAPDPARVRATLEDARVPRRLTLLLGGARDDD